MATIAPDLARLADCTGFRVRSPDGHLGLVEGVQGGRGGDDPRYLAVRAGRIIVLLVPIEEIESVDPDRRVIVLGDSVLRLVPEQRGADIVLLPRP